MTDLLSRYERGQCVEVWEELEALGPQVREEPYIKEAIAVANETVRRASVNIEQLIPKLILLGYTFGYGWIQPPADQAFSFRNRQEYDAMITWSKASPPLFSPESDRVREIAEQEARLDPLVQMNVPLIIPNTLRRELEQMKARPTQLAYVDALEAVGGAIPLSLRAWYELIGNVNFVGQPPPHWSALIEQERALYQPLSVMYERLRGPEALDPLFISPLTSSLIDELKLRKPNTIMAIPLAPAPKNKYTIVSEDPDYCISLPNASADAILEDERHATTFVNYLRISLHWGGFPGWEQMRYRPEQDLQFLREGLLPI